MAQVLARQGYDVEQNPAVPGLKNPDYLVEGRIFDAYSPTRSKVRSIAGAIEEKVVSGQTSRVVVDLDNTPVTADELREQLRRWPIAGLLEVLAVRGAEVVRLYPDPVG